MPQGAQGADISAVNFLRVADGLDGALYAGLAQQMQHGIGRAIGVVLDVIGLRLRELILRMEARHLQLSLQIQLGNGRVADRQEIVVLGEIRKHQRVDEQRRLPIGGVGAGQRAQLGAQILNQPRGSALLADGKVYAIAAVRTFGEWAQVQADYRFFEPAAGGGNYLIAMNRNSPGILTADSLPVQGLLVSYAPFHLRAIRCRKRFLPR
jgi:hypothetical protein